MNELEKITNLKDLSISLADSFYKVAALAGKPLPEGAIEVRYWGAPHTIQYLEENKMAVYVFVLNGMCLKVGKVGPKSQARYVSHHYNPSSSQSNLAKSLLAHRHKAQFAMVPENDLGDWIKEKVERTNFILDKNIGIPALNLLESFLQYRLDPYFEGFESQQ